MIQQWLAKSTTAAVVDLTGIKYGVNGEHAGVSGLSGNRQLDGIVTVAGILKDFTVTLDSAPGLGTQLTYNVLVNNVACGISVIIVDSDTQGSDLVNSFALAVGDLICIKETGAIS